MALPTSPQENKISCGFIILSQDKYLLCHASNGAAPARQDDLRWGIPKGQLDPGETQLGCALRETREECGIDLPKFASVRISSIPIHQYSIKGKTVQVYLAEDPTGILQNQPLSCSTNLTSGLPEVDAFLWLTLDEAQRICTFSQQGIFGCLRQRQRMPSL